MQLARWHTDMARNYSWVANVALPEPPSASARACVPIAIIPIALGALETRCYAHTFDPASAFYGQQLIRSLQVALITGCEDVDRLYRMLDSSLNGAIYVADEIDGAIIVTPPIPAAPAAPGRSIHSRLERVEQLLDNAYNGGVYLPDFGNPIGVRQQLADLILALEATGQLDDEMLAQLAQIALSVA